MKRKKLTEHGLRLTNHGARITDYRLPLTLLTLLTFLLLGLATPALAQEGETAVTDDEVNEIAKEVYCPVCESTPLDVCQTQACEDWRELIRTKLAEGESPEEIFAYFAEQYGDRVLATPPARGINLLLWIWPVVAVVAGAALFGRYVYSLRAAAEEADGGPVLDETAVIADESAADDYVSRIERELQKG